MANKTSENWKQFVTMLLKLGACNSSKEIATTINNNSDFSVTPQQVAGVVAGYRRQQNAAA